MSSSSIHEYASGRCAKLQDPNYINLIVSVVILIGLFISYLPQHHRLITLKTSEGISPYFILLGTTSATASFANILTLPASQADVACCRTISGFECFAGLLGIAQIGVQWICFGIIFLLFLIFFPRATSPLLTPSITSDTPTYRTAVTVGILCISHATVVFVISIILHIAYPASLSTWANLLGISAALLASLQYLPQIYTTYRLKHVGSLSIPMMCIQTPGGFLFAASLGVRLGREGWSTWGVYVVTAACQGVLLVMGIWYEVLERRRKRALGEGYEGGVRQNTAHRGIETDDEGSTLVEGERRPLLKAKGKKVSGRQT